MKVAKRSAVQAGLVLACLVVISGLLIGQTSSPVESLFPLFFSGGVSAKTGDFRWETVLWVTNVGSNTSSAVLNWFNGILPNSGANLNGSTKAVSLNGGVALPSHTLSIPSGQSQSYTVTDGNSAIGLYSLQTFAPSEVLIVGDFRLYTKQADGTETLTSYARLVSGGSVRGTAFTIYPISLGATGQLYQRKPAVGVVNPNTTPVTGTITIFDQLNVQRGSFPFTLTGHQQEMRFLDDLAISLDNGLVRVASTGEVAVSAVMFFGAQFSSIPVVNRVWTPVLPPALQVDAPANGSTVTSSTINVSGWRFKKVAAGSPTPALPVVKLYLDGALQNVTVTDTARPDVVSAFPQFVVPASSGFTAQLTNVANGLRAIKVQATDDLGVVSETTVNVTVNRVAIVPQDGNYEGWSDNAQSTPAGTRIFWRMTVSGGVITKLSATLIYMVCSGIEKNTGGGLVDSNSSSGLKSLAIVNGQFTIGPRLCDYLAGEFVSSTTAKIAYTKTNNQGTCFWLPGFTDCPSIATFAPAVVKVS